MALSSMTGFARGHGVSGPYAWAWEVKSVNGKGLDLRLRLPSGWDAVEAPVRARAAQSLARGSIQASLTVERSGALPIVRVNTAVLEAVLATAQALAPRIDASPPSLDGLLALKGVMEVGEAEEREDERRGAEAAVIDGFAVVIDALADMRNHEGAALGRVLAARLGEIGALTQRAELAPGRRPEAIRTRLAEQVAALLSQSDRFDPDRLHQEAILIAVKADVREELDRLAAHVAQAKLLIGQGGGNRPAPRFSRPGAQPRSQHAVRQGQRRRADQHRPRAQGRGGAVPRAGAERGIGMARVARNRKKIARRGLMLVLSSPSGAGKTTLSRMLLKADRNVELSVSVTTRPQRRGEIEGHDYFFIAPSRFEEMVKAGELLEWAEVFGYRYGTPRRPVEKALGAGRDVLFDIDWQGTQQLREKARDDLVSVFVLPPAVKELERRLKRRAQDSKDIIRSRMAKAAGEMSHWPEYDYVVVNRDKADAFAQVRAILAAERVRRERQIGLSDFVRSLQVQL